MGQHMRFSYLSHRREAKAQLILRICANLSEPCHKGRTKIELSCIHVGFVLHIRVHTNKMSIEKLRRQNLIFIYEDRPVSREAQTDLDRCNGCRIDFYPVPSLYTSYDWVVSLASCKRYPIFGPGFLHVMSRAFLGSSDLTTRVRR